MARDNRGDRGAMLVLASLLVVFSLAVIDDVELRIMERIQEEIAEQELTQPNAPDMGFSDEVVEEIGTAFR